MTFVLNKNGDRLLYDRAHAYQLIIYCVKTCVSTVS